MRPRSKISIAAGDALDVLRKRVTGHDRDHIAKWVLEGVSNLQELRDNKTSNDRVKAWKERHPEQYKKLWKEIADRYLAKHKQRRLLRGREHDKARYQDPKRRAEVKQRAADHVHKRRAWISGTQAETITAKCWNEVLEYFDNRCGYCGVQGKMSKDHVIPLSKGGSHTLDNLVPACLHCNKTKQARGPLAMVNVERVSV